MIKFASIRRVGFVGAIAAAVLLSGTGETKAEVADGWDLLPMIDCQGEPDDLSCVTWEECRKPCTGASGECCTPI